MEAKGKVSIRVRLRLIVSLPIITTSFTLGSGFMALGFTRTASFSFLSIAGMILILSFLACITGILLARGITTPLKKVTSFIEGLITEEGVEITALNEIRSLLFLSEKAMASKEEKEA